MLEKKVELDQRNNAGYSALLLAIRHDNYLNAYSLIKDGQCSPSIKDNERYFNALEWLLEKVKTNKNSILKNSIIEKNKMLRDSTSSFYTHEQSTFRSSNGSGSLKSSRTNKNNNNRLNYKSWLASNNQYFQVKIKNFFLFIH
jgi:hypothetical protein